MTKKIIIIGGGISGLTTAYRLTEIAREKCIPCDMKVLEASPRFGGLLRSDIRDGFLIEQGPDSFLTENPWALNLCHRLGLDGQIIPTNQDARRSLIYKNGQLHPVPEGFYLTVPRSLKSLMETPLLSNWAKLRMLGDFLILPGSGKRDQSVAHFIRRHFGSEVLRQIAQPMVGGIYGADLERLSLKAALPKLAKLEERYGSLIRGLNKETWLKESERARGPRYGLFMSLKNGMGSLVEKLVQAVPEESLVPASPVELIRYGTSWEVYGREGQIWEADNLCLALPAPHAAKLLNIISPSLSRSLSTIRYEPVAVLNLAYRKRGLGVNGFGFVVPHDEGRGILGCSFCHTKFPGRVPSKEHVLLRVFVGGALGKELLNLDDNALVDHVHQFLKECLPIWQNPLFATVSRWNQAMPQYDVGHLHRVEEIESLVQELPGLYLTGNAYRGVGIPDLIHHAESTAEKIAASVIEASIPAGDRKTLEVVL